MGCRRFDSFRFTSRLVLVALACLCVVGCEDERTPIQRGLHYLALQQVGCIEASDDSIIDQEGNWPQFYWSPTYPEIRVREVSPFMAAFIHHALSLVVADNADALGLRPQDAYLAHAMRRRAADFMRRFEARPEDLDAGTFGFWPYDPDPDAEETFLETLLMHMFEGPLLMGSRKPVDPPFYPHKLAVPSDADDTAAIYAALLDDEIIDNGPEVTAAFERLFEDWRDTGDVPRRNNWDWLPPDTGAFLTWLNYQPPGTAPIPNDVDLLVNTSVLYALGRYGRLDTPGVAEAIALINAATEEGRHRTHHDTLTLYYPDNLAFHYLVSRAYHEGGVIGLRPSVEILADDIEAGVLETEDGLAHWDLGAPHLNTAFAVLTLLNAGRDSPLIARGVDYLVAEQDPLSGRWDEDVFFIGRLDGGQQANWSSSAFTTAMAIEALCRERLAS